MSFLFTVLPWMQLNYSENVLFKPQESLGPPRTQLVCPTIPLPTPFPISFVILYNGKMDLAKHLLCLSWALHFPIYKRQPA